MPGGHGADGDEVRPGPDRRAHAAELGGKRDPEEQRLAKRWSAAAPGMSSCSVLPNRGRSVVIIIAAAAMFDIHNRQHGGSRHDRRQQRQPLAPGGP